MAVQAKSLSALLERSSIGDHEEVLKACDVSLKQSKGDIELKHFKCVALLKLDRYEDAIRVFNESGDQLMKRAAVERAYALYKVGELSEARKVAKSIIDDRGARHVEAQAVRITAVRKG